MTIARGHLAIVFRPAIGARQSIQGFLQPVTARQFSLRNGLWRPLQSRTTVLPLPRISQDADDSVARQDRIAKGGGNGAQVHGHAQGIAVNLLETDERLNMDVDAVHG